MRLVLLAGFTLAACSSALPSDPEPLDKSKVTADRLKKLLGKGHFSEEVHALRTDLKEEPTVSYLVTLEKSFHHRWKSKGIELAFDDTCKLTHVFLYAGGSGGYKRFGGELPAKLRFEDKPAAIRKKLGEPEVANESESPDVGAMWAYPSKGLFIQFTTAMSSDAKAAIASVGLETPSRK
jgi:hypothetical protein